MAVQTFVAIDVDSFEPEMDTYEISYKTGIWRADHTQRVIILGKDMCSEGKISYGLVEEMCQVPGELVQTMRTYRIGDHRVYMISTMGGAHNDQIMLGQIRVKTGLNVHIISNSEQHFINYRAIAAMANEFNKMIQGETAVVDVDFNSAQLSPLDRGALVTIQNLPLGTLRVRSLLVKVPATVSEHQEQIEEIVGNELFIFCKMYLRGREINNPIGIGKNIPYIINYMDPKAYGDKVDAAAISRFYDRLRRSTMDQIEERFGVSGGYASFLLPSVVVYKHILELARAEMFWVLSIRLCDGVAAEYAQDSKLMRFGHNFESDILAASRDMAGRYKCHISCDQVLGQYALGTFDNMRKYHGFDSRERLLPQVTAPLHACGKFISIKNSNECSHNIIMPTEVIGLSHLEQEIIANVARYNIRDFSYNKVQLETQLPQENVSGCSCSSVTILIAKLIAILQLANSTDRNHRAELVDCRIAIRDNGLAIIAGYTGGMVLETSSFDQKADFFEEIFGVEPALK